MSEPLERRPREALDLHPEFGQAIPLRRERVLHEIRAGREAITLPLLLITVAALAGVRVSMTGTVRLTPPSLMSLVLAVLLLGVLTRSGALAPGRLLNDRRTALENAGGALVLLALLVAAAQVFTMMTPAAGLLAFVFTTFFVLLLWNTLAVRPDRGQVLRSLAVTLGGAFVLKFVVLAAVYDPNAGVLRRVMLALLDGVTLGSAGFTPDGAATGCIAFVTIGLFFAALVLLPAGKGLRRRST